MHTKESIVKLLEVNDLAVIRALVVLNQRQTQSEQNEKSTTVGNGRGFRPCHAFMGTSLATFYERNRYLTAKQIDYWRQRNAKGIMRIAIYWKQLLEVANEKNELKQRLMLEREMNFQLA